MLQSKEGKIKQLQSCIHHRGMSWHSTNHQQIQSSDHMRNRRVGYGDEETELHNHSLVN